LNKPFTIQEINMKTFKMRAALLICGLALAGNVMGGVGYFGRAYVVLDLGSDNSFRQITSPQNALTNAGGGFDLSPDGNNPAFSTNLGTFNVNLSQTLLLKGFEINTYNDGGDNVTNAQLFYRITKDGDTPGSTQNITMASPTSTSGNDKFWQLTNNTTNLLNGLSNGSYTMNVYFSGVATFPPDSTPFTMSNWAISNGPSTTFTVIPEPSSILMMGLAGLAVGGMTVLKRRKRS